MYENLKLKAMVRKVANDYSFSYDDKILAYISIFEHENSKNHSVIKQYINEFAPSIWKEFNIEDTAKVMNDIVRKSEKPSTQDVSEIIKKLK